MVAANGADEGTPGPPTWRRVVSNATKYIATCARSTRARSPFGLQPLPSTVSQHSPPKAGGVAGGRRPHLRLPQSRHTRHRVDAAANAITHGRPRREPENACHAVRRAQFLRAPQWQCNTRHQTQAPPRRVYTRTDRAGTTSWASPWASAARDRMAAGKAGARTARVGTVFREIVPGRVP